MTTIGFNSKITSTNYKNSSKHAIPVNLTSIFTKSDMDTKKSTTETLKELTNWHVVGDSFPQAQKVVSVNPSKTGDDNDNSVSKIKLKLQDIQDAHSRISNEVVNTPLLETQSIGKGFCKVYMKCENFQHTGSFKARGACNVFATMTTAEKTKGCTVSGGRNFLYAMTYFGHKYSVPMNVVVPRDCPIADRQRYRENYAIVKVHGNSESDACLHAISYSDSIGSKYIHGTDRLDLIAGYGTLGLEVLTHLEQLDAVLCPVGSGGLVASLVLAVKSLKPKCLIYGVEAESSPAMTTALLQKTPVMVHSTATIADSLMQVIASNNAFNIVRGYLDRIITVDEMAIARAMIALIEREKMVVEGAGATAVAAIMARKVPELQGKNVVCIISGGNVNSARLPRVVERGLAAEGRMVKLVATLPDAPGAVARLLARVQELNADVKSFVPERTWMRRDIFSTSVSIIIETYDANHARDVGIKLKKDYPKSHFIML